MIQKETTKDLFQEYQEDLFFPSFQPEEPSKLITVREDTQDASVSKPEDSDYDVFIKQTKAINKRRSDVQYKASIRLVRRYYKDLFKAKNQKIVKKRYINCQVEDIYENMKKTLQGRIPQEFITEDLIYYTIGILNLREVNDLPCSPEVRIEIEKLLSCVRNFSKFKYVKAFKSMNFRIL